MKKILSMLLIVVLSILLFSCKEENVKKTGLYPYELSEKEEFILHLIWRTTLRL